MNRFIAILSFCFVIGCAAKDLRPSTDRIPDIDKIADNVQRRLQVENNFRHGLQSLEYREWNEAIISFTKVIALEPTNTLAFIYRGGSYFALGKMDNVIADFTRVIKLNPTNTLAYFNRGSAYKARGAYNNAIRDFNYYLKFYPSDVRAYRSRAGLYTEKRKYALALKDWGTVLSLAPNDFEGLACRANANFMLGNFQHALDDCYQSIALHPTNDLAFNNLAWFRATCPKSSLRNPEEALRMAQKACELTKWENVDWIDTLAAAYAANGNFEKAIELQKKAINLASEDGAEESALALLKKRLPLYEKHKPIPDGRKAQE